MGRATRRLLVVGAFVLLATGTGLRSQTAAAPVLRGRVVNALTREPIRGAIVTIKVPIAEGDYRTREIGFLTGSDGRFQFANVDVQTAAPIATKAGWLRPNDSNDERAIVAAASGPADGIELTLIPEARLEGRVVDRSGLPIPNIPLTQAPEGPGYPAIMSDAEGMFRIGNLRAGEYRLAGLEPDEAIVLAAGEVRANLVVRRNFDLAAAVIGSRPVIAAGNPLTISGVAVDPFGRAVPRANVAVVGDVSRSPSAEDTIGFPSSRVYTTAVAGEDGRFEFARLESSLGNTFTRGTFSVVPTSLIVSTGGGVTFTVLSSLVGSEQLIGGPIAIAVAGGQGAAITIADEIDRGRRPDNTFVLEAGQQATGVVVVVAPDPLATVTGRVTDALGDPVAAAVAIVPATPGAPTSTRFTTTDSMGGFRVGGIPAGSYRIFADAIGVPPELYVFDSSNQPRTVTVPRAYFPAGSNSLGSRSIELANGTVATGIDLQLPVIPASSVEVSATPTEGLDALRVDFKSLDDPGIAWRPLPASAARGPHTVAIDGLPAGRYQFAVSAQITEPGSGAARAGRALIDVATDGATPQRVTATLTTGSDLTGQLVFEGTGQAPNAVAVLTASRTLDTPEAWQSTIAVNVAAGAGFTFFDLPPGRYRLAASSPGWLVRSATIDGQDAFDDVDLTTPRSGAAVVTLTNRVATVSGTVTGAGLERSRVVVVPTDRRLWTRTELLQALTLVSGRFSSGALLAGDYFVAVMDAAEADTPQGLERAVATGVRVTLGEGERRVQNLVAR